MGFSRRQTPGVRGHAAGPVKGRDGVRLWTPATALDTACLGRAGATANAAPAARGTYSRPDAGVWLDHLACRSRRSVSAQRPVLVGVDPFPVAVGQAAVEHARTRRDGYAMLLRCD